MKQRQQPIFVSQCMVGQIEAGAILYAGMFRARAIEFFSLGTLLLCLSACEPSADSRTKTHLDLQSNPQASTLESSPESVSAPGVGDDVIESETDTRSALSTTDERKTIGNGKAVSDEKAIELVESMGFADAQSPASDPLSPAAVGPAPKAYQAQCNTFAQLLSDGRRTEPASTASAVQQSGGEEKRMQFCKKISNRLASVSMDLCMAAKLEPSGCYSVAGVPLMMREFPPLNNKTPKGRVLIVGGTHGDELTSVSVTFRWLEKLNNHHSGLFHWHVIPVMNPDGLLKRAASRTNSNGIDLNRNMPSKDWQQNALHYWEQKSSKNPRRYPGLEPNSEPETQWLVDEIQLFKPDAIIAVHAPYGVVDFDAHKLNSAPKSLGKLHLNLLGTYPGSLGNYAGINLNIPVVTLELAHSWEMPTENESDLIWQDIIKWLNKTLSANQVTPLVQ